MHVIDFGGLGMVTIGHAQILGREVQAAQVKRCIKRNFLPDLIDIVGGALGEIHEAILGPC